MQRKLRWPDFLALNSYWLGLNIASGIITPLLLPYLVVQFMPAEQKNTYYAALRVAGLAAAMLAQPLAGLLSDRSTSRFGRRRPYILAGAVLNVVFLAVMAASTSAHPPAWEAFFQNNFGVSAAYAVLLGGLILFQTSANLGQGALQGLIPDLVPEDQRGRASGVKAVFELLPVFLVLLMGPLVDRGRVWAVTAAIMAGYLITMLPTLFAVREQPLLEPPSGGTAGPVLRLAAQTVIFVGVTRAAVWLVQQGAAWAEAGRVPLAAQISLIGLAGLLAMAGSVLAGVCLGAWVGIGRDARARKSFIWWVINRLLFLAAAGSIQSFAQYFLRDVLHAPNPAAATTILLAVVAAFLLPAALAGGSLADRIGHRRLVFWAGLTAAAGAVLLIFSNSMPLVIVSGSIIGLAVGAFMSASWALGTRLVPPADAGRYLGISNLAGAGAGIVGAGIGGPLADFFNRLQPGLGYLVLFAIYAGLFVFASLALRNVKGGD